MKSIEVINKVKELLNLSNEVKVEEVKEEVKEVVLAEEEAVLPIEDVVEEPQIMYVTSEELAEVKSELLSMIKALIEDKPMGEVQEVPQELSKQSEVELSENIEEVIHSPENSIKSKRNLLSTPRKPMTTQERVHSMLFNN